MTTAVTTAATITSDKNFHFIGEALIIGAAYFLLAAAASKNSEWWNNNAGFKCRNWIFSAVTVIIVLLILTIIYLYVWYHCLFYSNNDRSLTGGLFFLTAAFFFITFISIFLNRNREAGLFLGIITLILLIYLTVYTWKRCRSWYGGLMLVLILFMLHFLCEIYVLRT